MNIVVVVPSAYHSLVVLVSEYHIISQISDTYTVHG